MKEKFNLTNKTRVKIPDLVFIDIKNEILGKEYELSLTIVNKYKIKELNKKYRDIDEATDILSFPLSENFGEIYICPEMVKVEMKKFDRKYENFFAYIVIHGLVHLKGIDHSSKMESIEARFRKKFGI